MVDGGEGPDVGVDDPRPLADYRGAADDAVDDLAAGLEDDAPFDAGGGVDRAGALRLQALEDGPVRFQDVAHLAGIDPAAFGDLAAHVEAVVDQVLDGVGDLQLAAGRGLDGVDGLEDAVVEQVDADDGQVAGRVARLLDDADEAPVPQLRHAEVLRVLHGVDEYLAGRTRLAATELVDEGDGCPRG